MWSRIYLIPALTAEEDRDLARRYYADQAREKELLGGNTSPYNSDEYAGLKIDTGAWMEMLIWEQIRSPNFCGYPGKDVEIEDGRRWELERCIYVKDGSKQSKSLKPNPSAWAMSVLYGNLFMKMSCIHSLSLMMRARVEA